MAIGPGVGAPESSVEVSANQINDVPQKEWPTAPARYWALFVIVLATFLTFVDQTVFSMLAESIKRDFALTDGELGFLAGPATIIFYIFFGIPLARLADIYPRKLVLAASAAIVGAIMALGGLAQNFYQFLGSRLFLMAGGSAHAPSSYSLLADAFPPKILTRAFALLQFGFIGGLTIGPLVGGYLVVHVSTWEPTQLGPLSILGWQWILIWLGIPSILAGLLFLTVKEPQRMAPAPDSPQPPQHGSLFRRVLVFTGLDAAKAIGARKAVYYPLFGALALSALDSQGMVFWRTPFLVRTYGLNEAQAGAMMASFGLIAMLSGLVLGGTLVEWLSRRHKDANVRAAFIFFTGATVCAILTPLMPSAILAVIMSSFGLMFGLAGAVPQNAAIQRVAPNAMRGQVTAIYLFMFTFAGACGTYLIGLLAEFVVGDPEKLWVAIFIAAAVLYPLATLLMYRAMKPYRGEVERLEALGR